MITKRDTRRKFSNEQVINLRREFYRRGTFVGYTQEARKLGIHPQTYFDMITGARYKKVGGPICVPSYMAYNRRGVIIF